MFNFLKRKKLHIKIAEGAGTITLTQALKGAAGTLHLGTKEKGSVYLWTPNTKIIKTEEAICDLRFSSLSPKMAKSFTEATKGLHLPAKCVLFQGTDPAKITEALEYFDYVLVPNNALKNDWSALYKTKILGYTLPKYTRNREVFSKKVH